MKNDGKELRLPDIVGFFFYPSLAKHVSICLNFSELHHVAQARQVPGVPPAMVPNGRDSDGNVALNVLEKLFACRFAKESVFKLSSEICTA